MCQTKPFALTLGRKVRPFLHCAPADQIGLSDTVLYEPGHAVRSQLEHKVIAQRAWRTPCCECKMSWRSSAVVGWDVPASSLGRHQAPWQVFRRDPSPADSPYTNGKAIGVSKRGVRGSPFSAPFRVGPAPGCSVSP